MKLSVNVVPFVASLETGFWIEILRAVKYLSLVRFPLRTMVASSGLAIGVHPKAFSNLSGILFILLRIRSLGIAVNQNRDGQAADAPSPSKAHVQTARAGVTSGARDFENVEQFGNRYLNRADSEKSPRLNPIDEHSSVTQRACQSIRNCWRQSENLVLCLRQPKNQRKDW